MTIESLQNIKDQMAEGETLVVCCKSFQTGCNSIAGITLRKIPQMLLGRCEFRTEGYPLNIIDLPKTEQEDEDEFIEEETIETDLEEPTDTHEKTLFD